MKGKKKIIVEYCKSDFHLKEVVKDEESSCCYDNHTANHSSTVAALFTGTLLFVPKSFGANHPLGLAAIFETTNRYSSLVRKQVFTLIPARCR